MTHVAVGPQMVDINAPEFEVEVLITDGRMHINVDGICRLRIYDMRPKVLRITVPDTVHLRTITVGEGR